MPPSVPQPSHLGLCVSDLDRSLRFYCDGLGFTRGGGFDLESTPANGLDRALEVDGPARLRSQWISHGALQIELLAFAAPSSGGTPSAHRNQRGLTHLAFTVDDVDAAAARLVEHGGTRLDTTRSNPGVELVFVADPDGTRVELMGTPG
jgi:lactoylglutathione lyase